MVQKVIILRGLPASGKSTWAHNFILKNPEYIRINKDELRRMLHANKYSEENEQQVLKIRNNIIRSELYDGKSIIVDDTNFNNLHIKEIEKIKTDLEYSFEGARDKYGDIQIEVKNFNVDPVECIKRNALRTESERVPEEVIWNMYNKYIKSQEYPEQTKLVQNPSLPHAIICDLEGTLALHNGRSPYSCKECGSDEVNEPVNSVLKMYATNGYNIIFLSSRNESCRKETSLWLEEAGWPYGIKERLYMREYKDNRKDALIKKEIFDNHIRDRYYIEFVLDDQDSVVSLWRDVIGLPCFQVAYGNF
jgi:predicted kinase